MSHPTLGRMNLEMSIGFEVFAIAAFVWASIQALTTTVSSNSGCSGLRPTRGALQMDSHRLSLLERSGGL
jgi:hypothetical protein